MKSCSLVMKGGVASGLVYGPLLMRLSDLYRFRGLAGASAGAIAAALGAAAEYGRQRGHANSFEKLLALTRALPDQLETLFQASPPFRPLLKAIIWLAPGSFKPRWGRALICIAPTLLTGALICSGLMAGLQIVTGLSPISPAAWPGLILATMTGATVTLVLWLSLLVQLACKRYNFGICTGRSRHPDGPPAITDWLESALQTLSQTANPLTFDDLKQTDIDLRIVTTNLSLAKFHILPDPDMPLWFRPEDWRRLFSDAVMNHLKSAQADPDAPLWQLPSDGALPVIVAVRMSLACPGLMEQVPAYRSAKGRTRLYLSDGGLSLNFPFEAFEQTNPDCPAFAIDLDTVHEGDDETVRVFTLAEERQKDRQASAALTGFPAFLWAMFHTMREAHIRTRLHKAAHADRLYRILLTRTEGGMNLNMTPAQTETLMTHGHKTAERILKDNGDLL